MEFWDRDPWLLGDRRPAFRQLRPSSRDDGIAKVTTVTLNANGCPRWLRFWSRRLETTAS
jgi:hypothetical protein